MTLAELQLDNHLYRVSQTGGEETETTSALSALSSGSSSTVSASSSLIPNTETETASIASGELTGNLIINKGFIRSYNFITGVSGWTINDDGSVEFDNGYFRGDITGASGTFSGTITGGSLNIPDTTTASSFHVDTSGNAWWGTNVAAGYATAPAKILATGAATFTSITATGAITAGAGSSLPTTYLSGLVGLSNTNISAQGWTNTCVFSATDYRVVAWATGVITTAAGTAYNITGANTGNMAATTYIYLDIAVSTTLLQITTTAATAVGSGKILIATAVNNADTTSKAQYQVYGGVGGVRLFVDNISANSASTNEFISNSAQIANLVVTDAKIGSLAVSKLTAGTISSKAITLAVAAGTGDSYIAAGKTDFTNTDAGFILGIDDSDSDKAKFFIGNTTDYFNFNGANVSFRTSLADAITIDYGSNISLLYGGSINFTSVTNATACTATLVDTAVGNIDNGTHSYKVTFTTATGETALGTISNTVTVDASHKQVALSNIPVSTSGAVTGRKIYRSKAGVTIHYYLLTTINNNIDTTYTDNTADSGLTGESAYVMENNTFGKIIVDGVMAFSCGEKNTFIGKYAGDEITTGGNNTSVGWGSQNATVGGTSNSSLGYDALFSNINGIDNVAVGVAALYSTTGSSNIAIGRAAGYYETGSDKLYIGSGVGASSEATGRKTCLIYGVINAAASSQQITFNVGTVNILDGGNIATGTTNGLKIGTATSQKLGFYNATPVDQPATISDPSGGGTVDAEARTAINSLIDRLQELGLIA